jgi:hypothetical protein
LHSLRWQGEQSTSTRRILAFSVHGEVFLQSVGPKIAAIGTPSAAPMCIGPESFVTRNEHKERTAISSRTVVRPARFTGFRPIATAISAERGISGTDPKRTTLASHSSDSVSATFANLSGNHRFADPKVAPGLTPTILFPSGTPNETSRDRIDTSSSSVTRIARRGLSGRGIPSNETSRR